MTRPGGRVLVIDQIAPMDPLDAFAVDRFERARDEDHDRLLPEIDLRQLFEANSLALLRERRDVERRELGAYLDLAACEGKPAPGRSASPRRARSSTPPPWAGTSWSGDSPGGHGLQRVQRRCAEGDP